MRGRKFYISDWNHSELTTYACSEQYIKGGILPEPYGPIEWWWSPIFDLQPDTSQSCKTADMGACITECLFTSHYLGKKTHSNG